MVRCVTSHIKCKTEWAIRSAAFSGPEASSPMSCSDSSSSSCTLLSCLFPLAPTFESVLPFKLLLCYSPVQLNIFFPLVGSLSEGMK